MKHIKLYEQFNEIDPLGEEDWDDKVNSIIDGLISKKFNIVKQDKNSYLIYNENTGESWWFSCTDYYYTQKFDYEKNWSLINSETSEEITMGEEDIYKIFTIINNLRFKK